MIPITQVLETAKEQLNLTHTTSEDAYLSKKINEAISKMNNLIRFTTARCCVNVVGGFSNKPEGFVELLYANVQGFPYYYVNQHLFLYYGLSTSSCDTTSKSLVDCYGIIKDTGDGRLDWGAQTLDGEADIIYIKLNKKDGEYLIPDECELAAAYYACYMYFLRMKDYAAAGNYNQLWIANSGQANSQAIRAEFDQDKLVMRRLMNDMFSQIPYFRW